LRRLQPVHAWWLVALLLAAQALGLAHRVAHAPGLPGGALAHAAAAAFAAAPGHSAGRAVAHVQRSGTAFAHGDSGAGSVAEITADSGAGAHASHEAGSAECRLIDQLAHADALCGSVGLPPAPLRTADTGKAVARPALPVGSAAAYLARGPPASA